jgi:hypothetical protein
MSHRIEHYFYKGIWYVLVCCGAGAVQEHKLGKRQGMLDSAVAALWNGV